MANKLRIRAKSLNLDLSGEPEYILRAYDAIRPVLLERFVESVDRVLEESSAEAPTSRRTLEMHAPAAARETSRRREHINVVVCNAVYNKIHLADREELSESPFGQVIEMDEVRRIFLNRSQAGRFREFFRFGKVLWRELTVAGKAVVKRADE